jgi:HPt (histidine-containing phosphotransfer) domain-containing protein
MGKTTQNLLQRLRGRLRRRDVKRPAAAPENAPAETRPATDALTAGFSSELFASLLLELPEHRQALLDAHANRDLEQLGSSAHKLLGAVVYCDLPELAGALRQLQQAIRSEDTRAVTPCCNASVQAIETLLANSGLARMLHQYPG